MKRLICFLLLARFTVLTGFSQTQVMYHDDFEDNNSGWFKKVNDKVVFADETSGYYMVKLSESGWYWMSWKDIPVYPGQSFKWECTFQATQWLSKSEFGLAWAIDDLDNCRYAVLSGKSKFRVVEKTKGTEKELNSATLPSGKTMQVNESHKLSVWFDGKVLKFLLDGEEIVESSYDPIQPGQNLGFYFHNLVNIRIDDVRFLQDRGKINIVEGSDTASIVKQNLGSRVNTKYTEKTPVIGADGKTLFFVRNGDPANIDKGEADDIWVSKLESPEEWGEAINLGRPINNNGNNSVVAIAPDYSYLIVKQIYGEDGEYKASGFSITRHSESGWGKPEALDVKNFYNNNRYMEASMNPEGDVLIFCIERDDTQGGKDIYFSKKQSDGSWSEPFNGGAVINSRLDEIGPFMAADNRTIYFASEGHMGYGSSDIFMTRRLDDSWTNWSTPQNLGPKINSEKWDAYFTVDAKGEFAYVVSTQNAIGSSDIFRMKLPAKAKPEPLCVLNGLVLNSKTEEPMLGEITFRVLETDSILGKIYANPSDGKFSMVLPEGYHYNIMASYPGYIGERVNLDLSDIHESQTREITLHLKPIEKEQTIKLNNIFFEENSSKLHYLSKGELAHLVNVMKAHPDMKIIIGGHVMSNQADEKFNKKLSTERAKAVYDYLIDQGISKKRLKYVGYGNSQTPFGTGSAAENARNRTVDFTIVSM